MSEATGWTTVFPPSSGNRQARLELVARAEFAEADANRLVEVLEDRATAAHESGLREGYTGHHYEFRTCPQAGGDAARQAPRPHKEPRAGD